MQQIQTQSVQPSALTKRGVEEGKREKMREATGLRKQEKR